ncbi:MAG: hypothetical protein V1747_04320 [Candidatus Omnitrophota bacterium]
MKDSKIPWSKEKASKHHKIASGLIILSGVYGLYLSIDDIIILGNRLSTFVLPYLFNYFGFFLSMFQIYTAICFLNKQKWAINVILWIFLIRLILGCFDIIEAVPAIFLLPYVLFLISNKRAGSIFSDTNSELNP